MKNYSYFSSRLYILTLAFLISFPSKTFASDKFDINKFSNLDNINLASRQSLSLKDFGDLIQKAREDYKRGNHETSKIYLKKLLKVFNDKYGKQPSLKLPNPGGFKETRINIPGIFKLEKSHTVSSNVIRLNSRSYIPLDSLFENITTQISRNPLNYQISTLQSSALNNFGGCLYSGKERLNCARRSRSSLRDPVAVKESNDIHSIYQEILELHQKNLIALGGDSNYNKALLFAEMSRHTDAARIAPIALYGFLNYDKIASNSSHSRLFNSTPSNSVSIGSIRKAAKRQNATIVYYSTIASDSEEKSLFIWVVKPSGDIFFRRKDLSDLGIPLKQLVESTLKSTSAFIDRGQQGRAIIQAVRDLRTGIKGNQIDHRDYIVDLPTQISRLKSLHNILISPIKDLLPINPESHVIFVPHKYITLTPFAALQDSEGKYLIEKHTIRTAYNFSSLIKAVKPIKTMPTKSEFLAIGNSHSPRDLKYVRDGSNVSLPSLSSADMEVVDITSKSEGHWYRRGSATLKKIEPYIKNAKILHFATHGLLDFQNPKDFLLVQKIEGKKSHSFLIEQNKRKIHKSDYIYKLWYDRNQEKGWQVVRSNINVSGAIILSDTVISAEEILSFPKNDIELVVLSACNTARGLATEGGVLGLPFTFSLIGVPRVVVSLWSVPDKSTRVLMIEFYDAMRRNIAKNGNASPASAMRDAMLKTKEIPGFQDPIFWAGFTMMNISY